jgi:hypothetical protein
MLPLLNRIEAKFVLLHEYLSFVLDSSFYQSEMPQSNLHANHFASAEWGQFLNG